MAEGETANRFGCLCKTALLPDGEEGGEKAEIVPYHL